MMTQKTQGQLQRKHQGRAPGSATKPARSLRSRRQPRQCQKTETKKAQPVNKEKNKQQQQQPSDNQHTTQDGPPVAKKQKQQVGFQKGGDPAPNTKAAKKQKINTKQPPKRAHGKGNDKQRDSGKKNKGKQPRS